MGEKGALLAGAVRCFEGGSGFSESRLLALVEVKMKVEKSASQSAQQAWKNEIERAITNAKRSERDKWWRRLYYRETSMIARAQRGQHRRVWRPGKRYRKQSKR